MTGAKKTRRSAYEVLEQRIEEAQERVIRTKAAYDKATDDLQVLLDKRDAMRKDELWKAVVDSGKSYEEVLRLVVGK